MRCDIPLGQLQHVAQWKNLTLLKLNKFPPGDFAHLSALTKLRVIHLAKTHLDPSLFATLAKCTDLEQIKLEYEVKWAPGIADDEWIQFSDVTKLTKLKKLNGLFYHPQLGSRLEYLPQSISSFKLLQLPNDVNVHFFRKLSHFSDLKTLLLDGKPQSITNDAVESLSTLSTLRGLTISSSNYDYYPYRHWKKLRKEPNVDPVKLEALKYKCYSQLNLSTFACLTQLTRLYVQQDPFDEEELWKLTTLRDIQSINFGWYFDKEDFHKFLSSPIEENTTQEEN